MRAALRAAIAGLLAASCLGMGDGDGARVLAVHPSGASVPANLLRVSIAFDQPQGGPVLPRLSLAGARLAPGQLPFLDAEQLGIVKSAVSRRVRDLEGGLGARLLNRTTRHVALTETGAAFYDRCLALLAGIAEAEEAASRSAAALAGRVRVSGPVSFGIHCLTPAVGAFLQRHPGLAVDLDLNDRLIDVVGDGFDLAVRISRLKDSSLIARRIVPIRYAACASPGYLSRFGTPAIPADLSAHKGIAYSNVDSQAYWQFATRRRARS